MAHITPEEEKRAFVGFAPGCSSILAHRRRGAETLCEPSSGVSVPPKRRAAARILALRRAGRERTFVGLAPGSLLLPGGPISGGPLLKAPASGKRPLCRPNYGGTAPIPIRARPLKRKLTFAQTLRADG